MPSSWRKLFQNCFLLPRNCLKVGEAQASWASMFAPPLPMMAGYLNSKIIKSANNMKCKEYYDFTRTIADRGPQQRSAYFPNLGKYADQKISTKLINIAFGVRMLVRTLNCWKHFSWIQVKVIVLFKNRHFDQVWSKIKLLKFVLEPLFDLTEK